MAIAQPGIPSRQPRFAVGVVALCALTALFGALVLTADDDAGEAAATTSTVSSVPAAPPPGTFDLNADEADRAAVVLYQPYVEQGTAEMVVVDLDGDELARVPANGWSVAHRDRGVDLNTLSGNGYTAEPAPEFEDPVPGCQTVHSAGGIRAATCPVITEGGPPSDEIRLIAPDGTATLLAGPVHKNAGQWQFALPSPDGKWVLAQWSGECEVPVAYLFEVATRKRTSVRPGDGDSWAIGWAPDSRAVVGLASTACGSGDDAGTFLLDPATGERKKLHSFSKGAMVADLQGWRLNRLERVVLRAFDELGIEEGCCGEPSHGGPVAATGMVVDGFDVQVLAVPLDVVLEKEDAGEPEVTFTCGEARYRLSDGSYDRHADQDTVEYAADLLMSRLYCQSSRPPRPVPARTIRVAGEAIRGAEVTLVATGLSDASKAASVTIEAPDDSVAIIASDEIRPDGSFRVSFLLPSFMSHDGPCPTPAPCDVYTVPLGPLLARLALDAPGGGQLGEVRFDVVPARMGVAYRSGMVDECGPARVQFDGRTWVLRPTASFPPLEHGQVNGIMRVVDDGHAVFDPDGMERVNLIPDSRPYFC